MKSVHFGNPGNVNMRGKKTLRYTDVTMENFKERELLKELDKHILIGDGAATHR